MNFKAIAAVLAASLVAGCVTVSTTGLDATASGPATATASGTDLGTALNAARASNGLSAVVPNAQLMAAAQVQVRHMASTNNLTHTGPGGSSVGQRVRAQGCSGYRWVGENVAFGQGGAQSTMTEWMGSSGHRRNALNSAATQYGSATIGSYRVLVLAAGC